MKRATLSVALLILAAWGTLVGGTVALVILGVGVVVSMVAVVLSIIYLARIYQRLPEPRPPFYRMVLDAQISSIVLAGWVGYLTVARVSRVLEENGVLPWSIPVPGPQHSAPISAAVIIIALLPPIYYAVRIYRARRAAVRADDVAEHSIRSEDVLG